MAALAEGSSTIRSNFDSSFHYSRFRRVLEAIALRDAENLAKKIHRQYVIRKAQKAEDRRKIKQRAKTARRRAAR